MKMQMIGMMIVNLGSNKHSCEYHTIRNTYVRYVSVGPENLRPGPLSIRVQGPCRGEQLPRTSGEKPNSLEAQSRIILSSASQDFKRKSGISSKVASKMPLEEEMSRMGPTWEYGVGVVQGKYVTSALNPPTNVLAVLMGKDS